MGRDGPFWLLIARRGGGPSASRAASWTPPSRPSAGCTRWIKGRKAASTHVERGSLLRARTAGVDRPKQRSPETQFESAPVRSEQQRDRAPGCCCAAGLVEARGHALANHARWQTASGDLFSWQSARDLTSNSWRRCTPRCGGALVSRGSQMLRRRQRRNRRVIRRSWRSWKCESPVVRLALGVDAVCEPLRG
jgi:hypothetical protein